MDLDFKTFDLKNEESLLNPDHKLLLISIIKIMLINNNFERLSPKRSKQLKLSIPNFVIRKERKCRNSIILKKKRSFVIVIKANTYQLVKE